MRLINTLAEYFNLKNRVGQVKIRSWLSGFSPRAWLRTSFAKPQGTPWTGFLRRRPELPAARLSLHFLHAWRRLRNRATAVFRINRLDAQGRIELVLISAALVAGALIASASFVMVRQQIIDNANAALEVRAKFERREIEVKLASLLAQAGSLASNPATASTLANSAGREADLLLFLSNQKLALAGATLTLTNVRGEMLVGRAAAAPAEDAEQQVVAAMMQAQASVARVQAQPAGALLKIAFPVLHRLSGNINWAVVLRVPLAGLTDLEAGSAMLDRDGTRLSGRRPDTAVLEARAALDLPPPLAGLGLTYSAFSARDRALKSLDYLLVACLSALALLALAALLIARFSTHLLLAPTHKLIAAAESMTATGHPAAAIPLRGDSEFDRLAGAFNSRVERFAESYEGLEPRVDTMLQALDDAGRQEFLSLIFKQSELMASSLNELLKLPRSEAPVLNDCAGDATPVPVLPEPLVMVSAGAPSSGVHHPLADHEKAQAESLNESSPPRTSIKPRLARSRIAPDPVVPIFTLPDPV